MLFALEHLSCSYLLAKRKFRLTWHVPEQHRKTIRHIIIAEIPAEEQLVIHPDRVFLVDADAEYAEIAPSRQFADQHKRFVIVGSSFPEVPKSISLQEQCRKMNEDSICCRGLCIQGTVRWRCVILQGYASVTLHSSVRIPSGYLRYSYEYCNVRFSYPVYDTIPSDKEFVVKFRIPDGATQIEIHSCGTAVVVVADEKKQSWFGTLFSRKPKNSNR